MIHELVLLQQPTNPTAALLVADYCVKALGSPIESPLDIVRSGRVEAGFLPPPSKLTVRELLPGLKLRLGSSEIEIKKLIPTAKEVVYRLGSGRLERMDTEKFVRLANQQGYRKVWNLARFLGTLKTLLKPILSAIPLMWVLKTVINSVRKKPTKFIAPHQQENDSLGKPKQQSK